MHHYEIKPVSKLTINDINALAQDAVDRHIPLHEANVYEGHIAVAFAAAYLVYAQEVVV